jgi:hypothetical protein
MVCGSSVAAPYRHQIAGGGLVCATGWAVRRAVEIGSFAACG